MRWPTPSSRDPHAAMRHHGELCFDDDGNVYLELQGFQFEASTSGELSGDGVPSLTVKLPLAWTEKLGLIRVPAGGSILGVGLVCGPGGGASGGSDGGDPPKEDMMDGL
jgi:hypothetical protein